MEQGTISVFYGEGKGKTSAAVGEAVHAVIHGKSAIIIQFLKGKQAEQIDFIQNLEPQIRWFSFEKEDVCYDDLPEEKKKEALSSIQNGMNFAKKVLTTNEADLLVLDEVLGLIDNGLITVEEIVALLDLRWESMDVILTGREADERILAMADSVSKIEKVK